MEPEEKIFSPAIREPQGFPSADLMVISKDFGANGFLFNGAGIFFSPR
jgi:hypothetical protein